MHLKSYKYSAIDKSPISNYILKPYVRSLRPHSRSVPVLPNLLAAILNGKDTMFEHD